MLRFINDVLTYKASIKKICIIVFVLIVIGALLTHYDPFNLRFLGSDMVFIGIVIIISVAIEHIKQKYSLKI